MLTFRYKYLIMQSKGNPLLFLRYRCYRRVYIKFCATVFYLSNFISKNTISCFSMKCFTCPRKILAALLAFISSFSVLSFFLSSIVKHMCSLLLILIKLRARNVMSDRKFTFLQKMSFPKIFLFQSQIHYLKGVVGSSFTYVHPFVLVLFNFNGFSNLLLISLRVSIFQIFAMHLYQLMRRNFN